ncbi:hypothetical protein DM02DRAFT_590953 [Periconia macrospinosa]|uniref:Zn(2)-C6 fungal-type domain-containing protein n=1 Tax=Periconia macrospinosa TaxID=97972 RepID=A0A2V1DTI2_9PLEO|nr:hypothetical protein DM02DRAFT_590953 [Periconia macrospinosa]
MESPAATQPQSPAGTAPPGEDPPKIKRAHQACLNCRKRKSRCLLDQNGTIPCLRCKRDNLECVLGGSNRGGRRVRRKTVDAGSVSTFAQEKGSFPPEAIGTTPWTRAEPASVQQQPPPPPPAPDGQLPRSQSPSSEIQFGYLQNPSDALGILARVAESSSEENGSSANGQARGPSNIPSAQLPMPSDIPYTLLRNGSLTLPALYTLLARYKDNYHPYYPLVPAETFDTARLAITAKKEPHLLTAVLLISSKDLSEESHIYEACAAYMKSLVSDLAAGGDADVEAVEALLILAEWAPYTQRRSGKVGKGEEDKESWMHVGLALRIAYFLALDKYSFRYVDQGKDPQNSRKRLLWTAAYVSDRHISIRIGKAFWSRGPGPLTTLRREDYPSLMPKSPNEEDYASIFQANLELTQLFSNVHDVLYSNPGSSFRTHMSGSYIKFIDDFRSAIYGWKSVWGTLTCSPSLKACLLMSYDYLRLYINAFAFQATILRALPSNQPSDPTLNANGTSSSSMQVPQRVFANNVGAVGDVRFIYEGLDAAKAILTTANHFVDPEKALRYMPLRYYLYLVYAGVFLYRARCTGVISNDEDRAIRAMINETVARLRRSSVASNTGTQQHPGNRYSQLLELLWAKAPRKDKPSRHSFRHPGTHIASAAIDTAPPYGGTPSTPGAGRAATSPTHPTSSSNTAESPAMTEQMGDFGWTDLSAVGDFAMNGGTGGGGAGGNGNGGVEDGGLWSGFLPLDMGWSSGLTWDGMGFEGAGGLGMAF